MSSPFEYTDRDFVSIRNQLIDYIKFREPGWSPDPSDFAYSLLEGMSYLGDMMSYYVDRAAQESNIFTANNPENVFNLARMYGYSPGLAECAWVEVTLTNEGTETAEIVSGTKVGSMSSNIAYEFTSGAIIGAGESVVLEAREGDSRYVELGVSSGGPNQVFSIPDSFIDGRHGSLDLVVWDPAQNSYQEHWVYQEILLDAKGSDYVFTVQVYPNGTSKVQFGDGVSGRIPNGGWNIGLFYRVTAGSQGNAPGMIVNRFVTSWDDPTMSSYATITVHGESPRGGRDLESVESIRMRAVGLARTQRRAVTPIDYESIAKAHSKILDAVCETRVWSRPTIWIAPSEREMLMARSTEQLGKFVSDTQRALSSVSLAGVTPDVRCATPLFFRFKLEIIIPFTVDEEYASMRTEQALLREFSYERGLLDDKVSVDYLVQAVHNGVPTAVVQYIRVIDLLVPQNEDDWKKIIEGSDIPESDWVSVAEVDPTYKQFAVLSPWPETDASGNPYSRGIQVIKSESSGRSRY